ncbi:MAG: phosphatidate cytidylyltransferase [Treponemataceae bacterium]|nr:phosphatidate cytidylyltransferase [Treponemataceae bacterium]
MALCEYQKSTLRGVDIRRRTNDILKELFRKSIHLCTAFVPFLLKYLYLPTLIALGIVLVFYIVAESLRYHGINVPLISSITKAAARKRDENKFVLGPVCLAVGVLITAIFFKSDSAAIGIYALALGDGLASLVGKLIGKSVLYKMQGKTAEGSMACFIAIFVSSYLVTNNTAYALMLSFLGTFIELMPLKDYDNVIIPVALAAFHQFILVPFV